VEGSAGIGALSAKRGTPGAVCLYDRAMGSLPVSREDVERAATVIAGRLHRTPTLSSRTLGQGTFLKAELLQRTGSFKPRGVFTKLASLSPEERARGVIAASAGNHAAALAFCAAEEGISALAVMYRGASELKRRATESYGAEIDEEASGQGDVFERLHALQEETGRVLVHPFDDPLVVAGQGTVGLEILEDVPDVDVVVVPCGGGGLYAGIASAVAAAGVRVVPVEPESSRALHAAVEAGESVRVETATVADGLNAPFAGEIARRTCVALGVAPVLLTEDEIREGFRFLYERAKLACEPAGAAAVAAVLAGKVEGGRVVCVVSGGNVAAETAAGILAGR
jgi:threonine dehydratase